MDTNFFVSAMSLLTVAGAVPAAKVISSRRHASSTVPTTVAVAVLDEVSVSGETWEWVSAWVSA